MQVSARRVLMAVVIVVVGALAVAAPASAHVSVHAEEAVPGSTARVVFRMPNEGASAIVRLEVHLQPQGAPPIPSAETAPVPGWSAEVEYETLAEPVEGAHGAPVSEAVSAITWTADADGTGIQPGEFGEFPAMIGPLPEVDELYFPTFQTYAGDEGTIEWLEPPDPSGGEIEDPAPVLRLTAPEDDGGVPPEGATSEDPAPAAAGDGGGSDDGGAGGAGGWLGLAGLVAGLAGLALGGLAFARTRR